MTLADPWLGAQLVGDVRIVQRVSAGDRLYRAEDESGRNLFARVINLTEAAAPGDWIANTTILRQLRSPRWARFIGAVEHDGWGVLVTDFVGGERLRDRARNNAASAPEALHIVLQTADALDALHRLGLAHGRIEPRGIFVGPDSLGNPQATQTSYGLASGLRLPITAPEYHPPNLTPRAADIYSLGATLFFLLTSTPPQHGWHDELLADLAPSPLRPPSELDPDLRRFPMLDDAVRALTADAESMSIQRALGILQTTISSVEEARSPKTARPRTFVGPDTEGSDRDTEGQQIPRNTSRRPGSDPRRRTVVFHDGEEYLVQLRGSTLKLRNLSSGERWGPRAREISLNDFGVTEEITAISSLPSGLWFGTARGRFGFFDFATSSVEKVHEPIAHCPVIDIEASPSLVVCLCDSGPAMVVLDDVATILRSPSPAAHVSVAERANRFAIGRRNGIVEVLEVDRQGPHELSRIYLENVRGLSLSVDGTHLSVREASSTRVFDVETKMLIGDFGGVDDLIFRPRDVISAVTMRLELDDD